MSWIAIAGKTLEFRGQLIQPRSFQDWADKQLQQNIEEIAREETNLFFKRRAAKKSLWNELELAANQPALRAALRKLATDYFTTLRKVAGIFDPSSYVFDSKTYVIPRFLVNPCHRGILETALSRSNEFQRLRGGPSLQSYFYDEFIRQLDEALIDMKPATNNPVKLDDSTWYVVGTDRNYKWSIEGEDWDGHFFVHRTTVDLTKRGNRNGRAPKIDDAITKLNEQMGILSIEEKRSFALPWIEKRNDLIEREKVANVHPLAV